MTKDLGKSKAVFPFNKKDWETLTVEEARRLVGSGADVNAKAENGITALMLASSYNSNRQVIQVLIDNVADVNVRDERGITALMRASMYNSNKEVIQVLLDNGADVNARDKDGRTPLMWASWNNSNRQVIQVLIDNGADVNARTENGSTALMVVSSNNGNPEVIEFSIHYFIKQGIEVDWNEIWELVKENEDLKGTPVYWQINELRFNKHKYDEALIN